MQTATYLIVQLPVVLLLAPLVNGIILKIKALTQKRRGAPILQLYFDLYKLLKKHVVISDTASWIFRAAPYVVWTTAAAAALLAPVTLKILPAGFPGDLILLFYLLALGRFFLVLAGLDTGGVFGGMGSSREAWIAALIEPAILVSLITVALYSRSTAVAAVYQAAGELGLPVLRPTFLLPALSLLIVIIAETARIPVDDPATHLELTMVHEAMVLEYSGRYLALMEYGAAIKQLVLLTLLVNIILPHDQWIMLGGLAGIGLAILIYVLKIAAAAVLIAVIEVNTVKFRFFSIPNLAALAFILSILGFLQTFIFGR